MNSLIVRADVKRLLVTLLVACIVLTACSAQPTTEQTDTDATVAEADVEAGLSEDPTSITTTTGASGSTTSQPATQHATSTTTTTATTVAPPDLDEELSEFEDLEALLDELDDLLADL
jgi:ABC-type transport system substrate-binding protein